MGTLLQVLKNMKLTKKRKIDRRTKFAKFSSRWFNRYTLAALAWGIIIGTYIGIYIYEGQHASLKAPNQTMLTKVEEVRAEEIPCDRDPITYVRCRGEQLGYNAYQITTFQAIARCESGHNPMAKNKSSTATGIYQFINSTFHAYCAGKNVYDFKDNIDCFYKVLEINGVTKGLNHWNASKSCWGK